MIASRKQSLKLTPEVVALPLLPLVVDPPPTSPPEVPLPEVPPDVLFVPDPVIPVPEVLFPAPPLEELVLLAVAAAAPVVVV